MYTLRRTPDTRKLSSSATCKTGQYPRRNCVRALAVRTASFDGLALAIVAIGPGRCAAQEGAVTRGAHVPHSGGRPSPRARGEGVGQSLPTGVAATLSVAGTGAPGSAAHHSRGPVSLVRRWSWASAPRGGCDFLHPVCTLPSPRARWTARSWRQTLPSLPAGEGREWLTDLWMDATLGVRPLLCVGWRDVGRPPPGIAPAVSYRGCGPCPGAGPGPCPGAGAEAEAGPSSSPLGPTYW